MKTPKRIGQSVVTGIDGTLRGVTNANLRALVESRTSGVLVTIKRDGRPQLSNVSYAVIDGTVRVSVTDDRAKTRNARRDPRVSLHVTSEDFWSYAVVEGDAELSPVAADPHDATVEELIELYRAVSGGDHPDWDDYRDAMVNDRRLVLRLPITKLYGMA
jgi:PPOX class probable F420-dependent enzyme